MDQQIKESSAYLVHDGIEVPESPILRFICRNRFGSVPGLEDDELADPDELERQVLKQELGPIWLLPVPPRRSWIQPIVCESLGVTRGAFDSADYLDQQPAIDKAAYKAQKLRQQLKDLLLLMDVSRQHVPGNAKYVVLKYLRMGIIDTDDIEDVDMLILARQYLQARRLQRTIWQLEHASYLRRQKATDEWIARLG